MEVISISAYCSALRSFYSTPCWLKRERIRNMSVVISHRRVLHVL